MPLCGRHTQQGGCSNRQGERVWSVRAVCTPFVQSQRIVRAGRHEPCANSLNRPPIRPPVRPASTASRAAPTLSPPPPVVCPPALLVLLPAAGDLAQPRRMKRDSLEEMLAPIPVLPTLAGGAGLRCCCAAGAAAGLVAHIAGLSRSANTSGDCPRGPMLMADIVSASGEANRLREGLAAAAAAAGAAGWELGAVGGAVGGRGGAGT